MMAKMNTGMLLAIIIISILEYTICFKGQHGGAVYY